SPCGRISSPPLRGVAACCPPAALVAAPPWLAVLPLLPLSPPLHAARNAATPVAASTPRRLTPRDWVDIQEPPRALTAPLPSPTPHGGCAIYHGGCVVRSTGQ